jgi:uncharacterized protein (DUF433 family)
MEEESMNATVNELGRISGTRITVYDLVPYLEANWVHQEIANLLSLSRDHFQAGLRYIEENREAVMAVHREIEERNARGNPPEVLAKLEGVRERMKAWLEERKKLPNPEVNGAGNIGRR